MGLNATPLYFFLLTISEIVAILNFGTRFKSWQQERLQRQLQGISTFGVTAAHTSFDQQ